MTLSSTISLQVAVQAVSMTLSSTQGRTGCTCPCGCVPPLQRSQLGCNTETSAYTCRVKVGEKSPPMFVLSLVIKRITAVAIFTNNTFGIHSILTYTVFSPLFKQGFL